MKAAINVNTATRRRIDANLDRYVDLGSVDQAYAPSQIREARNESAKYQSAQSTEVTIFTLMLNTDAAGGIY